MQQRTIVIGVSGVALLGALGAAGTYALSGTESTTVLDKYSTVTVDGQQALSGEIVAGRVESKYHPLPWVGARITGTSCPSGLKVRAAAALTCTAKDSGGKEVKIPVKVTKVSGSSVTWTFTR
jgi:hypothetical protein